MTTGHYQSLCWPDFWQSGQGGIIDCGASYGLQERFRGDDMNNMSRFRMRRNIDMMDSGLVVVVFIISSLLIITFSFLLLVDYEWCHVLYKNNTVILFASTHNGLSIMDGRIGTWRPPLLHLDQKIYS